MYAVTSIWLVSRTRQTLRRAEFGFLGVVVYTRVQTPRRCGAATFFLRPLPDFKPGVASFFFDAWRPLRTSWEVVGIRRGMVAVDRRRAAAASAATRRSRRSSARRAHARPRCGGGRRGPRSRRRPAPAPR